MLNLECRKANTNLPDFRLRNFPGHIKFGFRKVSVNRTVPSGLFSCRQTDGKCSVFNNLKTKNKIFTGLAQFLYLEKIR
jgi:hypothetical protein